jgi:hypothetical protein
MTDSKNNYYSINIINTYNHTLIGWCNYYTSNEGLLEERDKEENVAVIGGAGTAHCLTGRL